MNAVCYKDTKEFIQVREACCIVEIIRNCIMNAAWDLRNVGSFTAYACRCRQLSPIKLSLYPKQGWRENHITHVYHKNSLSHGNIAVGLHSQSRLAWAAQKRDYKAHIPLTIVNFKIYFLEVAIRCSGSFQPKLLYCTTISFFFHVTVQEIVQF